MIQQTAKATIRELPASFECGFHGMSLGIMATGIGLSRVVSQPRTWYTRAGREYSWSDYRYPDVSHIQGVDVSFSA